LAFQNVDLKNVHWKISGMGFAAMAAKIEIIVLNNTPLPNGSAWATLAGNICYSNCYSEK